MEDLLCCVHLNDGQHDAFTDTSALQVGLWERGPQAPDWEKFHAVLNGASSGNQRSPTDQGRKEKKRRKTSEEREAEREEKAML